VEYTSIPSFFTYFEQLESTCKPFLATLIKASIEEGYNIIFLCTKNEGKMKYLRYLSEFIYLEFGYPMYEYKRFADGSCRLLKYNEKKILKKCNKLLENVKKRSYMKDIKTEAGRKRIMKEYKKMKKSELKKILKKRDIFVKGMTKEDMLDTLEAFM
jgi:aspartyl/asparaginyl-tRNA synthetase